MKKAIVILAVAAACSATAVFADEYVNGYTRQDGTYVQPHFRTSPNSTKSDNYSSRGNTNPYTREKGAQPNEYSTPPAYDQSYGRGKHGR